jgi:hypothetical protein
MHDSFSPIPIRHVATLLSITQASVTRAVKRRNLPCVFPTPNDWRSAYTLRAWVDAWMGSNNV